MKKFLVGLLTVALAASMLVGCGKKEEKKKAEGGRRVWKEVCWDLEWCHFAAIKGR